MPAPRQYVCSDLRDSRTRPRGRLVSTQSVSWCGIGGGSDKAAEILPGSMSAEAGTKTSTGDAIFVATALVSGCTRPADDGPSKTQ